MAAVTAATIKQALELLHRCGGVLQASDARLPSVSALVAGEPVRGSWWAHPRGHDIFHVLNALENHPDVAFCRLVGVALLCCLAAVGARPNPSLVLLAYVAGALLALIPVTPGGLGFVEAGLTGMLTLAGVGGEQAVVATLAYRLMSFWLPLPAGAIAYLLFRHRYGSVGSSPATITSP